MKTTDNKKPVKLEQLDLAGTTFLIDPVRQELRQLKNPANRIPFDRLKPDQQQGGISFVFDKLSKNIYRGFLPLEGLPPMTEKVFINSSMVEVRMKQTVDQPEQLETLHRKIERPDTRQSRHEQKPEQRLRKRRSISR
jgi:hypothetical protein